MWKADSGTDTRNVSPAITMENEVNILPPVSILQRISAGKLSPNTEKIHSRTVIGAFWLVPKTTDPTHNAASRNTVFSQASMTGIAGTYIFRKGAIESSHCCRAPNLT